MFNQLGLIGCGLMGGSITPSFFARSVVEGDLL